jgi:hypothetical protein
MIDLTKASLLKISMFFSKEIIVSTLINIALK